MAHYNEFTTVEEGMTILRQHVEIRNKMGGAMYYNMLNDECCQIANKLRQMGADYDELAGILGAGTFR